MTGSGNSGDHSSALPAAFQSMLESASAESIDAMKIHLNALDGTVDKPGPNIVDSSSTSTQSGIPAAGLQMNEWVDEHLPKNPEEAHSLIETIKNVADGVLDTR